MSQPEPKLLKIISISKHHGTLAQTDHYLALRQIKQRDNLLPAGLCRDIITKVPRHITGSDVAISMAEPQLHPLCKWRTEIQVLKAVELFNCHF